MIGGHRYLFKQSSPRYPTQFWAEVLAFRIGKLIGVDVPPACAAIDSLRGVDGALIEFFFGRPNAFQSESFVHGGDYCVKLMPDYDRKKGR